MTGSAFTDALEVRQKVVPWILAILGAAVVVVSIEPFPVGVFQDDGIYTVLAKSLAEGQGYRYLHMPDAPNATHYPPLYPLLLAAIWKIFPAFPANITVFKFVNAGLIGVTAVFTWLFARRCVAMGPRSAALTAAAFGAGAPMVFVGVMVLSEPMFLAALFPVLMAAERAARTGSNRDALIAGVAGGLLALIRTLGALAIPATALVLLWRRRWMATFLVCLAGGLVMLPWQLWISANDAGIHPYFMGKYGSYGGWLLDGMVAGGLPWIGRQLDLNLRLLILQGWEMLGILTLPYAIKWPATVLVTGFFLGGWWLLLRRAPVAAWFVMLYMTPVIVWPFGPSRFTFAIWPLIGLAFGLAFTAVLEWRPRVRPGAAMRYAAVSAGLLLVVGYGRYHYLAYKYGWWTQAQRPVADRAQYLADWVQKNTSKDVLIAAEDDLLIYLYTGRHAIPLGSFTPNDHMDAQTSGFMTETLRGIIREFDVDYVLTATDVGGLAALGLLQADPPELRRIGALKIGAVFQPASKPVRRDSTAIRLP
jgi:hypothetical protein